MTERERNLQINGLQPWGSRADWDTMKKAKLWGQEFVEKLEADDSPGWGVLIGVPGSGKTHLLCGIANALIDRGVPTIFVYTTALLNALKGTFNGRDNETNEFLEALTEVQVLMLDDLGAEYRTGWSNSILEFVINARYKDREARPTVIATNLSKQALMSQYPRIASRVLERGLSVVHMVTVGDYRLERRT